MQDKPHSASQSQLDPAHLKDAMARVPAAVHIVATNGSAGLAGFTASSPMLVSLSPPIVLACLNQRSPQVAAFRGNGVFSINLLTRSDRLLSEVFAGSTGLSSADRFRHGNWFTHVTGAPVLSTASMALDCRLTELKSVGSHVVLFGEVADCCALQACEEDTLMYGHRRYLSIAPDRLAESRL